MSETPSDDRSGDPGTPGGLRALNPKWQSRGLVIRVVAYMAGAHLFAAFLFLLFAIGAHHGH
jgi:hypothetical protein